MWFMGKLRNLDQAYISFEKLAEYCLNELHPHRKDRAIVFKTVLGIGINEASLLKKAIMQGLSENDCVAKGKDNYGERFSVEMKISIFQYETVISTGWIVRVGEDYPD